MDAAVKQSMWEVVDALVLKGWATNVQKLASAHVTKNSQPYKDMDDIETESPSPFRNKTTHSTSNVFANLNAPPAKK